MTYSFSFYNGLELNKYAYIYAKFIKEKFPKTTHLLCSSSSGMAIASAIASLQYNDDYTNYRILYFKNPEHTFRDSACSDSGCGGNDKKCVIVDDLIDSGATISHLIDLYMNSIHNEKKNEIQGIVVWKTFHRYSHITSIRNVPILTLQERGMRFFML